MSALLHKFFILVVFFLFCFLTPNAFASTPYYGSSLPSGSVHRDNTLCSDLANFTCNNGPSVGNSGGCGTSCDGGNPWEKRQFTECGTDPDVIGNYISLIARAGDVCSTGDKYNSSNPPVMDYGQCSCATGNSYKTCCNGRTAVGANSYAVDPYSPLEADCGGYSEIRCGDVGAPCGTAACEAAFPTPQPTNPPTPTPTPTPTQGPPQNCTPGAIFCSGAQMCLCNAQGTSSQCGPCTSGSCNTLSDGTAACNGAGTPAPTSTPPPAPPPAQCYIYYDVNERCVQPSELIYANPNKGSCDQPYTTFINTCMQPYPIRFLPADSSLGNGMCVGQQYGCAPVTISGFNFQDNNSNRIKETAESLYTASSTNISVTTAAGPFGPTYSEYGYGVQAYKTCMQNNYGCDINNPMNQPWWWTGPGGYGYCYRTCNSYKYPPPPMINQTPSCWNDGEGGGGCVFTGGEPDPNPPAPPQPVVSQTSPGIYKISSQNPSQDLTYGTYTVTIGSSANYSLTEPPSGNSFAVIAGFTKNVDGSSTQYSYCDKGTSLNGSCLGGSLSNLDFGLKTADPWIQSTGSDIRRDSGFSNQIPANASCGAYASLPGNGGSPGVIYSGGSAYSFGSGQASSSNWVVGGSSYPETYTPTRPNLIRTSYNYLLSVAKQAGITPVDISTYCGGGGLNQCLLSSNIPNGLYIANGNMTLEGGVSYTFAANKNFVILVDGDLTIKTKIIVPNGSTATFSSSKNITVDRTIGESSSSSTASDIEGYYSADKNFIIDGNNNCSVGADKRLNIAGAIVSNAALSGGIFQNNRTLCEGNSQCPVFSVAERPDFVLNAPEFLKHPSYVYQETAP